MSLDEVKRFLGEAEGMGVKEYYFTGGEPFMNKDIFEILRLTLLQGPASVLTNGVLIKPDVARQLRALSDASDYSLDLRISIDGWDAASNDPIRGEGTYERILEGIRNLAAVGLVPVITVTEACADAGSQEGRTKFLSFLRGIGIPRPRLKVMPLLRLGAEVVRLRSYTREESLRDVALTPAEESALQCSNSRMVTSKGVYVCPILIDFNGAKMGETLASAAEPFELKFQACFTCHQDGLSCRT